MKKRLPIVVTSVGAGLLAISIAATVATNIFKTQINSALHLSTSEVVHDAEYEKLSEEEKKEKTTYFKSEYASEEELTKHEEELCEKLESEGASLLLNKNDALPLAAGNKISVFSQSSVNIIYGGTGSGGVSTSDAPKFLDSLKDEGGFEINSTLKKMYNTSGCKRTTALTTGGRQDQYTVGECPIEKYTEAVKSSFSSYGDAAVVVISRSGGEGCDLPKYVCSDGTDGDYLRLSPNEIDMFKLIKEYKDNGTFKKVIVLLNGSNQVQCDYLETYGVDSVLWIGDIGMYGGRAVAKILNGTYNPSGRIVDTFLANNASSPAYNWIGGLKSLSDDDIAHPNFTYTDKEERGLGTVQYNQAGDAINNSNSQYILYQEGIYVGYRYYETRYYDHVTKRAKTGTFEYDKAVAFPFGTGLSYTTFDYSNFTVTPKDDKFEVSLIVKNTGNKAGKHTAQIYFQSPYTQYDIDNGIEKAAVELCGFKKTDTIAPGDEEKVTIEVDKSELRSYDANTAKTYIMDAGDYYFTVGRDAHDAVNNILAKQGKTMDDGMDDKGNAEMVASWNPSISTADSNVFSKSPETGYAITNQFDDVDPNRYAGTPGKVTYLSRNDWEGTFQIPAYSWKVTDQMWADGLTDEESGRQEIVEKMKKAHWADATTMPTQNATNGLTAVMFKDIDDLSDPLWDQLLDQSNYEEMINCVYNGFHQTQEAASVGIPATKDDNGPQGFTAALVGGTSGMCYTSEDVMAATYNMELVHDMGHCMGEDCLNVGYAGFYAPGANTHRTQYDGRNFEYYSEDPFVAKSVCAVEVPAIEESGVFVLTKHFALNENEEGRYGIGTWANEQSIREIYLEAFSGISTSDHSAVMSSFNRLGVTWAGAHYGLMTEVLRNEWGVKGVAITDCSYMAQYMDYRLGILAGQNYWDGGSSGMATLDGLGNDPQIVNAVRASFKRFVFSISHSLAMNGIVSSDKIISVSTWVQTTCTILVCGSSFVLACGLVLFVIAIVTKKKQN